MIGLNYLNFKHKNVTYVNCIKTLLIALSDISIFIEHSSYHNTILNQLIYYCIDNILIFFITDP